MKSKYVMTILVFFLLGTVAFGAEVSVPELIAEPGQTVTVGISIDDATGVAGGDITLGYDSAILTAKEARATVLVNGLSPITNINTAGKAKFAMAAVSGLRGGSGAMFEVDFEIKADAKGTSPLELLEVALFNELGEDIATTTRNGSIKVKEEEPIPPKNLVIVNAGGKVDELISTTIEIDETKAIAGGDIVLLYDPAVVSVEDVKQTALITGISVVINKDVAGKISISMAATTGLGAGKGAIFNITLKGKAVGGSKLDFESAALFDENGKDIVVTTVNGKITVEKAPPAGPPVEKEPKGKMLSLQATYEQANAHEYAYVDTWKGEVKVEAGQFLEYQVTMFSGNPAFSGSVDLITSDGTTLRDSLAKDQNDMSAHPATDLSKYARDQWYHRKISLDALAGKTVTGVMIAADSTEHRAGLFRVYIDNIQITDGEIILKAIYLDEEVVPITGKATATDTTFAGVSGMKDYSVSVVGETPVTPVGKSATQWGKIKDLR